MKLPIKDFRVFLSLDKGCGNYSGPAHVYRVKKFYRWLGKKPFNLESCKLYLFERKQGGTADATIAAWVISFRHWSEFLEGKGLLEEKIGQGLKLPPKSFTSPDLITPEELRRIINVPSETRKKDKARMDTLLLLLAASGLRLGEALGLKVKDVDLDERTITLKRTKTRRGRVIPLNKIITKRLKESVRRKKASDYLFPGKKGKMTGANVWLNLKRRCKKAGIKKNIHPHTFRHSFITSMVKKDVSILKVQRIVGHIQTSTTQRYTHLVFDDLKNCIEENGLTELMS